MPRTVLILLLAFAALFSCGESAPEGQETLSKAQASDLLEAWPDSGIYPLRQHISSQHTPLEKFKIEHAFDGDPETRWESRVGLNVGEGMYWTFDGLPAKEMQVDVAKGAGLARVSAIRVWLNGSFLGQFPSGAPVSFHAPVYELVVQLLCDEGWNPVSLPLNNRYGDSLMLTKRYFSKMYNSRPVGISEIRFLDHSGAVMPVKAKPRYSANMRVTGPGYKTDKYTLHDGFLNSGIRLRPGEGDRRFFYQFRTNLPLQGFRLFATGAEDARMTFRLFPPNGEEHSWEVKPGWNVLPVLKDTLGGRHFSFGWQEIPRIPELALMELDIWSGARWFQLVEDSVESMPLRRKDSLMKTALAPMVDQVIRYERHWAKSPSDGTVWDGERDVPFDTQERQWERIESCFRADGSFWYFLEFGRPLEQSGARYLALGRWFPVDSSFQNLALTYDYFSENTNSTTRFYDKGSDSLKVHLDQSHFQSSDPWLRGFPLRY